jgi:hypothetical protein
MAERITNKAPYKSKIDFGKWKVTISGNMNCEERNYFIPFDRLQDENWILHLSSKNWIDFNEFIPAYLQACENAGIEKISMLMFYKN